MATRQEIVAEARAWLGTPYHHQARVKGVGCDCGQLVIGVGLALGIIQVDDESWRPFAAYGRAPNPARMLKAIETFLLPITEIEAGPGDAVFIEWRDELPMHMAILANDGERLTMVHSLITAGKVVEHGFTGEWRDRVHSWWRYPGMSGA